MPKAKKQTLTQEERLAQALVPECEQPYEVPGNWAWIRLLSSFLNVTSSQKKLQQKDYLANGLYAVVDQGKELIGGYTDDEYLLYDGNFPVIVFGDHTRIVKYIDFPFAQGADGVKLLCPRFFYNSKFFYYVMQNVDIPDLGYRRHYPLFPQYSIPLPPLAEQRRIVNRIESLFNKLDRAKELAQTALDSFDTRKAAILHKAFTGELTANWREANGVGSDSWESMTARDICGFITKGETPTQYVESVGEIPFLKVYNIRDNKLDFDYNPAFIPRNIHENKLKRSRVYPNDVIMNIVGPPLQKVAIVSDQYGEWNINQAIAIFRPKDRIITKYLFYCLTWENTLMAVLHDTRGVVGQSNISLEQCRDLPIPLPSIPEQTEIVRILDSLLEKEQQARQLADIIEKIDLMKKAILARAFRGELGTNDPSEESTLELLKGHLPE